MKNTNNHIFNILDNLLENALPGLPSQLKMAPESRGYFEQLNKNKPRKKAGVLLLLFLKNNLLYITFIKRTEDGRAHSGQIAFPGGKFEDEDINMTATALRETEEEIGVNRNDIIYLGSLTDIYVPVSNYQVTPIVGYINFVPQFVANKTEVDDVITIPLYKFLFSNNIGTKTEQFDNLEFTIPYFQIDAYKIWGATAMIMHEFIDLIQPISDLLNENVKTESK